MAEIRQRYDRASADSEKMTEHRPGAARRLDRLTEDHDVEGAAGILDEIGVGVALHHGKPARHAGIDVLLRQFDAAAVDAFGGGKEFQQCAVAAADVEYARGLWNHLRDRREIGAQGGRHAPTVTATAFRNPRMVLNNSGSSSRKASWPRSVAISTKLTMAAVAFSACATCLFSAVGNSQSLVNETIRKRDLARWKALASTPSCSAARSK